VLSIVVAYASNRVIGYRGELPWRLPSDLRHFRELTIGHTVLMGRRTFDSLPDAHRPLRERRNVVVSANPCFRAAGVEVHANLDAALGACGADCFVIGGASVYEQTLPLANRVYATDVAASPRGDVFFPPLARQEWRCVQESEPMSENDVTFSFRTYDRIPVR
jgi:dihydrofolate reductase